MRFKYGILSITILLISCSGMDDDIFNGPKVLAELNAFQVYHPLTGNEVIDDQIDKQLITATINGKNWSWNNPEALDHGITQELKAAGALSGKISLAIKEIKQGIFPISDLSGFSKASFNNIPCSKGEIRILRVDKLNNTFTGVFEFTTIDAGGDIVNIENGKFHNIIYSERFEIPQNHEISATINGEEWRAEVFNQYLGAATFGLIGLNKVGNVQLEMSTYYFAEEGVYNIDELNSNFRFSFAVAKKTLSLKKGIVIVESSNNGELIGSFNIEFEGYQMTGGRFHYNIR